MSMNIAASTKNMARDEWLRIRRKGIGGSDASAVAGLNRYKSPVGVFLDKTGQIEPDEAGEAAYWGNVLEDVVAREFTVQTGLRVQRSHKLYQHPKHNFMLGNVDRLILDKGGRGLGILECKTASAYKMGEWEDEQVPDEYAIQLQHYMAVLGVDYGYFAVLIGGQKFQYKLVERNDRIIDSLIQIEDEFWNRHVVPGIPPMIDGSDASANLLNQLYPVSAPASEVILDDQQAGLVRKLLAAKEDVAAAAEQAKRYENELKSIMGENELAIHNGETLLSWKSSESTRIDSKRLKKDQPDLYEKYANTTSSRRFLVK
ncbi:YqaJ viral recombinase family protein [Paenibacillus illinoisensis]|uniref:YqaJ viral recombinase family nuclease n=1 Tax=Paenibacillus illinoisensis TaxID=59845 RepID=UPI00203DF4FB|nr:YqaJ viral recombinase family protein [Paenibacillus illinoisensis]MCM3206421.1 YqaJ viral recombinase family protein [Paenibacillus illinoisensis]